MEELLLDILAHIRALPAGRGPVGLAPEELDKLVRRHSAGTGADGRRLSKRGILPFYLRVKAEEPDRWRAWGVDAALEERLLLTVRMKPRRTASGVATITVITRPHPCAGDCVYCPCDLRMPKSYLASEPACQRAERAWFDPYLQVSGRLRALTQMGHATDKVELIVLGGTWSDYPRAYQVWFVRELFRALNDGAAPQVSERVARERAEHYRRLGIACDEEAARRFVEAAQRRVDAGELTYNEAWERLYAASAPHREAAGLRRENKAPRLHGSTCDLRSRLTVPLDFCPEKVHADILAQNRKNVRTDARIQQKTRTCLARPARGRQKHPEGGNLPRTTGDFKKAAPDNRHRQRRGNMELPVSIIMEVY